MEYKNLRFETIQVSNRSPIISGKPTRKGTAKIEVLQIAALKFNDFAIEFKIKNELKNMADDLKKKLNGHNGVMVASHICEWEYPDPNGNRGKKLYSMHIGGKGNNFQIVYRNYKAINKLHRLPPNGWRHQGSHYIWVRSLSNESHERISETQKLK